MEYTCFEVNIEDKIAHIRLNRPEKRNAMSAEFWHELPDAIRHIDAAASARVIVISSTGPHFTAGLDLNIFAENEAFSSNDDRQARVQHGSRFLATVKPMQDTFSAIEDCRVPVLAAIQGGCIGGGIDLITACDMRYATKDAYFTIFETNIGMTADVGTFPRICNLMGEGIVREMAYTGRKMPAEEAREFGLVNRLYDDQELLLEGVMEIAREIAAKAPHAVYGCKRMITYARDHSTADALDYVAVWNMAMLSRDEIMEGVSANMQKKTAEFVDLPPLKKQP